MEPKDFSTTAELIAACKKRYPVGSYFKCAVENDDICEVIEESYQFAIDLRGKISSLSSFKTADVAHVGTDRVTVGIISSRPDDGADEPIVNYLVRKNIWAEPCNEFGNAVTEPSNTSVDMQKFKVGDTVQVCKAEDDPTNYGYHEGIKSEKISAVGGLIVKIISTKSIADKGIYYEILGGHIQDKKRYIHQDRLTLLVSSKSTTFNIGNRVIICDKKDDKSPHGGLLYDNGRLERINRVGGYTGKIQNIKHHDGETYYTLSTNMSIHESCLILIESHIQSSIKQDQHDQKHKEASSFTSSGSAKVRRLNQQISVSAPVRGIGLKGAGSKIKLGGNHRYH